MWSVRFPKHLEINAASGFNDMIAARLDVMEIS
jgi:hypothetical protein